MSHMASAPEASAARAIVGYVSHVGRQPPRSADAWWPPCTCRPPFPPKARGNRMVMPPASTSGHADVHLVGVHGRVLQRLDHLDVLVEAVPGDVDHPRDVPGTSSQARSRSTRCRTPGYLQAYGVQHARRSLGYAGRVVAFPPVSASTPSVVTAPNRSTGQNRSYSATCGEGARRRGHRALHGKAAQVHGHLRPRHRHITSVASKTGPSTQERSFPEAVSTTQERQAP